MSLATVVLALSACSSEDLVKNDKGGTASKDDGTTTTFIGTKSDSEAPATRTWLKHTIGKKGVMGWTTGDKVWIGENIYSATLSNAVVLKEDSTQGLFNVPGTFTKDKYEASYTGGLEYMGSVVIIRDMQTQTKPNNTEHFRDAGDCAAGIAKKRGDGYSFTMKHKPTYLCFLPRCKNATLGAHLYLTKIVATTTDAFNSLNGSYQFSVTSPLSYYGGGATKTTTLVTKGTGAYANGFPLTNTKSEIDTNGAYMIIVPGQHTLKLEYYIYDSLSGVEGVITKTVTEDFKENTVYDIKADLTPKDYTKQLYWQWGAKKHYWQGFEASQPLVNGGTSNDYPKSNATPLDERSYTKWDWNVLGMSSGIVPVPQEAKGNPNWYEAMWYIKKGDPHWDDKTVWTFGGRLYKGGTWFKKKAKISGFSDTVAPGGKTPETSTDAEMTVAGTTGIPDNADTDYFFLPALGEYGTAEQYGSGTIPVGNGTNSGNYTGYDAMGNLSDLGVRGCYWTSTPALWSAFYENSVYYLFFKQGEIGMRGVMEYFSGNAALGKNYWKVQ